MRKYAKMMRPSINIRGQQEAGGQAGIPDTRTGEMQGCSVSPDGGGDIKQKMPGGGVLQAGGDINVERRQGFMQDEGKSK